MGICFSCDASNVAMAKIILLDGWIQELTYPIKASYVLAGNPTCCIFNSDKLEFNDAVSAIEEDEELQLGGLYFALPVGGEQDEEEASGGEPLMKQCGGDRRRRCRKKALDFPVGDTGTGVKGLRRRFEARLSSIPE